MRHFVVIAFGSAGDVFPMGALASALARRGHRVQFMAGRLHASWALALGLDFLPLETEARGTLRMDRPNAYRAFSLFWHRVGQGADATMEVIARLVAQADATNQPRPELVASSWAVGARMAHDHFGLHLTTVHMSPSCMLSSHAPPVFRDLALPASLPLTVRRAVWWLVEAVWLDPICRRHLKPVLRRWGMAPVRHVIGRWIHSPERVVAMFPAWFCAPQPDWPAPLRLAGFPLADQAAVMPMPESLVAFLDAGAAPIVFITGSAMRQAGRFFVQAVEVCRRLGRRGLILTRHAAQLPPLPEFMHHQPYAPLSRVLPRSAALVSHAGIGTASLALQAGVPQLLMPYAHDQFDNARLFARLGVGRVLPSDAPAATMTAALQALLSAPEVAAACRQAAQRMADDGNRLFEAVLAELAGGAPPLRSGAPAPPS